MSFFELLLEIHTGVLDVAHNLTSQFSLGRPNEVLLCDFRPQRIFPKVTAAASAADGGKRGAKTPATGRGKKAEDIVKDDVDSVSIAAEKQVDAAAGAAKRTARDTRLASSGVLVTHLVLSCLMTDADAALLTYDD